MADFLRQIVEDKRDEVAAKSRILPLEVLRGVESPRPRDFTAALSASGISAVAEIKRRSPSRGSIRREVVPSELARSYAAHGARALSVLSDATFFGGRPEDLTQARAATSVPVLRKDFTIDPYQLFEARGMGADAVLLIVRILGSGQLTELLDLAGRIGLAAIVEVHTEDDLRRAIDSEAEIIGLNNRDLETFEVDLDRSVRLRGAVPLDRLVVAESGIRTRADVVRLERAGFDAVLVGESLMRATSPGSKLAELLGGAR